MALSAVRQRRNRLLHGTHLVDLSGGQVVVLLQGDVKEALVVAKIQVSLCSCVCVYMTSNVDVIGEPLQEQLACMTHR